MLWRSKTPPLISLLLLYLSYFFTIYDVVINKKTLCSGISSPVEFSGGARGIDHFGIPYPPLPLELRPLKTS